MQENNGYRISHHVQLPGGRQIEVVYLDSAHEHPGERPSCPPQVPPTVDGKHEGNAPTPPTVDGEHAVNTPAPWRLEDGSSPERARSDIPVGPTPRTDDSPTTVPGKALHVCPRCAGEFVHPLDWVEETPGRWRILMRCPDCDLLHEGVFGQVLVERLDEELDKATAALLSDLKQLTHANMTEEIELFSRALQLDLIGPSDF